MEKQKVRLSIFDQIIHLRCPSPDEMYALARLVDERMHSFSSQDERISVTQLAILAALSFAQETREVRGRSAELERKVSLLEQKLSTSNNEHAGHPRH
jgi:cell division protein ZapA (FtsZ GTPase activity inhibitor)